MEVLVGAAMILVAITNSDRVGGAEASTPALVIPHQTIIDRATLGLRTTKHRDRAIGGLHILVHLASAEVYRHLHLAGFLRAILAGITTAPAKIIRNEVATSTVVVGMGADNLVT